ncbi:MAG: hypothetical protein ABIQ39_05905 [Ilumatobacteraceae bacterium]
MTYLEHDRMAARREEIDTVTAFLEWLDENGYVVAVREDDDTGDLYRARGGIEQRLSEYFNIDTQKLAEEKDAMLHAIRNANGNRDLPLLIQKALTQEKT